MSHPPVSHDDTRDTRGQLPATRQFSRCYKRTPAEISATRAHHEHHVDHSRHFHAFTIGRHWKHKANKSRFSDDLPPSQKKENIVRPCAVRWSFLEGLQRLVLPGRPLKAGPSWKAFKGWSFLEGLQRLVLPGRPSKAGHS